MRLPCLLLVSPLIIVGCAHVRTSERVDERVVHTVTEHTMSDDWTYRAAVSVGDEVPLVAEVTVTRAHECEDTTRDLVHRTRIIDRTPERPGWTWAFGIAGTLGLAGLATGISLDATGTAPFTSSPLRVPGMPMYGTVTQAEPPLYLTIAGAALAPFLLVALGEGIRSTGSTEDLGEEPRTRTDPSLCESEPAQATAVRLMIGDEVISEGNTDERGIARLSIADLPSREGDLRLVIEGEAVDGVAPIADRVAAVRDERARAAAAADLARRRAERLALLDRETTEGRCSEETHAELEVIFQHASQYARLLSSGSSTEMWDLVTHSYEVVDLSGDDFTVRPGLRGEHHLFVVGLAPPQLTLRDGHGYTVTEASAYAGTLATADNHTVSRVIRSSTGEQLTAHIVGRGCVLIMLFERFS